jgi:hypothetical protein
VFIFLQTEPKKGVRVVTYNSPLYYANGELFIKNIYKATGVKPEKLRKILKRIQMRSVMSVRCLGKYM